jgi:hypothetical protein
MTSRRELTETGLRDAPTSIERTHIEKASTPIDQRLEANRMEQVERVLRPCQLGVHDRLRRDLAQCRLESASAIDLRIGVVVAIRDEERWGTGSDVRDP